MKTFLLGVSLVAFVFAVSFSAPVYATIAAPPEPAGPENPAYVGNTYSAMATNSADGFGAYVAEDAMYGPRGHASSLQYERSMEGATPYVANTDTPPGFPDPAPGR